MSSENDDKGGLPLCKYRISIDSGLGKSSEDSVFIDAFGKLLEIHICNGEIVFDTLDLRWNGAEFTARSFIQFDDE